jgi:peroxiredoxin
MAKAYDMFAGEEPYNCSKRGTVVIGKDGRISFYQEQPMREARKVEDLSMAVAADVAEEQRANEGGSSVA